MDFLTDPFLVDSDRFDGTVMVTGAGGCIGSWVLAILSRSGVPVVATDLRIDTARPSLLLGQKAAENLDWVALDVTDAQAVSQTIQEKNVRAIVHLAGLQIPFCAENPALGARVNVEGTINILQAARESGIKRIVLASSVAALAFPVGSGFKETLYGAYKVANEQSAFVYWADWQVPSITLRPTVVYGVGRDQGMTSKATAAIQAAAQGVSMDIPYTGDISWLYAGEAAAGFISAISEEGRGAFVFDMNGRCETVEKGIEVLKAIDPNANVTSSGAMLPFPPDLDEQPFRAHVPDYPVVTLEDGIETTYKAFRKLIESGQISG